VRRNILTHTVPETFTRGSCGCEPQHSHVLGAASVGGAPSGSIAALKDGDRDGVDDCRGHARAEDVVVPPGARGWRDNHDGWRRCWCWCWLRWRWLRVEFGCATRAVDQTHFIEFPTVRANLATDTAAATCTGKPPKGGGAVGTRSHRRNRRSSPEKREVTMRAELASVSANSDQFGELPALWTRDVRHRWNLRCCASQPSRRQCRPRRFGSDSADGPPWQSRGRPGARRVRCRPTCQR
jgi:hypothetical protein